MSEASACPGGLPRPIPHAPRALFIAALVLVSCAKRELPSGGPPDIEPPRLISTVPDSGAARVPLDVRPALTFSEGMEPKSTGEAIALAPRIEIRQRRWSGRTVTLVLAEPLRARQSYTLFVGAGARDRHGNLLQGGASTVFTTAESMPPGVIEGEIEARGFAAAGTSLWVYSAGREPDSTARDFDALGLADLEGRFRVVGLPVPGDYRLWAFADLNSNRSFEPQTDILAPSDTTLRLMPERREVRGLHLTLVNPRAPGRVRGTVLDSLAITGGPLQVVAVADNDSTRRELVDVGEHDEFDLKLPAGSWKLRAWRDLDRNRGWQRDAEPASEPYPLVVRPADDIQDIRLVLRRPGGP